jgi:predicted metal-dependent RNase
MFEDYDLDYGNLEVGYFEFSAHSGKKELQDYVKKMEPKVVFFIHGEEEQIKPFARWTEEELGIKSVVPKFGEKFDVEKYL